MTRIAVPFLDANILDVTVVKWHKAVGDPVGVGEVVAEVSSDKAAYEIESPVAGTLLAVLAPEKSIVPVKTILALVGAEGETDDGAAAENARILSEYRNAMGGGAADLPRAPDLPRDVPIAREPARGGAAASVPPSAASAGAPLRATPKARRLAEARGIDLAEVARANGGVSMVTEKMVADFAGA
jgi:pyruvate dehydrogenase E2 component (dihydrolipoamide acetyltransferase)